MKKFFKRIKLLSGGNKKSNSTELKMLTSRISEKDLSTIVEAEENCGLDIVFSREDIIYILNNPNFECYGLYSNNNLVGFVL